VKHLDQSYDPPTRPQLMGEIPGVSLADNGNPDHGPYVVFRAVCGAEGYHCSAGFRDREGWGAGDTPRAALLSLAASLRATASKLECIAREGVA
jgi:hypothetical protein